MPMFPSIEGNGRLGAVGLSLEKEKGAQLKQRTAKARRLSLSQVVFE